MRFMLSTIVLFALVVFVSGIPATANITTLTTTNHTSDKENIVPSGGAPGGVYACTGDHWTGYCIWISPEDFTRAQHCLRITLPDGSTMKVRSIGPDVMGNCWLYRRGVCLRDEVVRWVVFPGVEEGLENFGALTCFAGGV